ncbi:DUF1150 family protein [Pseudooceanicola nanhaiensis]|uniref:DUF1150 family protein n=1 Tax=Pseudooceanicola nanhaiensis TaxID=375761 RepID=UPI001CD764FE|nr:DUF1150 domain-containing protein [Pseudooceanicola nanhaiensis]MCA0919566.1 DUF1150 domain-containing protein [Pseudooceanicola nanhaiensis]
MNDQVTLENEGERIVYIRSVDVSDLPKEVREQAVGLERLYAVHSEDGERLALVKDRELAFILARQNDMEPVTVH